VRAGKYWKYQHRDLRATQDASKCGTEQHFVKSTARRHAHDDQIRLDFRRSIQNPAMGITSRDPCIHANTHVGRNPASKPFRDLRGPPLQILYDPARVSTGQHHVMRVVSQGVNKGEPSARTPNQVEYRSRRNYGRHPKVDCRNDMTEHRRSPD
jgi:hypothetical protein